MYIRTREDALGAVAEILDQPDRRRQIVQSTVAIMRCLDADPRRLMTDCQALLLEDGLDTLRQRRRDLQPALDPLFEAAAGGLDALELTEVIRQVFPELRAERWVLARALLRGESTLREALAAAIRARGRQEERSRARKDVETALHSARPAWIDRAGSLRAACLSALRNRADVEVLHQEADLLFELVAVSDERAEPILADPRTAAERVAELHAALGAVRALRAA